ncbi:AMP-binding protein [Micromonospora okii]|uniref:AMP-binding protein n=1 Tax=Micromonospora okii TaxID=1182970 RepID=UPI001E52BEE4|nr:AMP-binding protein [Micromonospora okii]
MNLAVALEQLTCRSGWEQRPAVHEPTGSFTHGQVHDLAARAATLLAQRGVRPSTRVLIAAPDGVAWYVAFLATARLGAVAVPVNPDLAAPEHLDIVADCEPVLVVCPEALADRFPGPVLPCDDLVERAAGAPRAAAHPVDPETPLYVQYTSGTTGRPKGAVHRHADPERYHRSAGLGVVEVRPCDVTLSVSKLYFAYGFGNAFVFPLFSGSAAVLLPHRPGAREIAELVAAHRVSLLYAVPTAYAGIVADGDVRAWRSVRAAVTAGEALRPGLGEQASALLGAPLLNQLGSTEAGHGFCSNTLRQHRLDTIGRELAGYRLRILDDAGREVPDGTQGELWVRGETIMTGYLGLPDETAATLVDGWLRTKDLAVRNPDGTVSLCGRADDLEMVGGITVAPRPVEQLIEEHPAVREAAVVARPDQWGATRLHAFVVAADDADAPDADDLARWLAGRVAPFKVPRSVSPVPALPRTATGKLRRFVLRETVTAETTTGAAR